MGLLFNGIQLILDLFIGNLMSPLPCMSSLLVLDVLGQVMADMEVLGMELRSLNPLVHKVEVESLSRFDGVLAIKPSEHLHGVSGGLIVEIQDPKAAGYGLGRLDEISKIDFWVGLLELEDISEAIVIVSDILESHVVGQS